MNKYYHFADDRLRCGSTLPKAGDVLRLEGEIIPCERGFHASKRAFDALIYAPGANVALVTLRGTVVEHGDPVDKAAASIRENLSNYVDASEVLMEFARHCALDVIDQWDAPDIVRRYLETGDEAMRTAARAAVRDAASTAARAESSAAAWAAARDAAWVATGYEARVATGYEASDAARYAT